MYSKVKVFSGRSNPELTKQINSHLSYPEGKVDFRDFSDGEIWLRYKNNIRGADVFIVQPTNPPSDNIIELLLMIDAAKRASAKRITAVIPYFGYARQDRKDQPRVPISSRVFMDTIVSAGANRILTMDLHSSQIQGFANIPFDHLYAKPIFIERLKKLIAGKKYTMVSPDIGGVKFSRSYAKVLNLPLAIVDKRRPKHNQAEVVHLIGKTDFEHVLIVDDMIDTGGTVTEVANLLEERGCKSITVVATHGLFSGDCVKKITNSPIDKVIVTNSVNIPEEKRFDKLEIVSAAQLLADAIMRIHNEESISKIFDFKYK
jgi:ribose-phosphate pyrophosphokinase